MFPARKPYATAAWAYYQTVEETIDSELLARIFVYDKYADSEGILALIPQSLGDICVDPQASDPLGTDPGPDDIADESDVEIGIDLSPSVISIVCDGDLEGTYIEGARPSTPEDDVPPGTLLGSVSYEIYNNTATITDWEHLNWNDATPVYKAVRVMLNSLPDCVSEVKVSDAPTAFWTSLGFLPDFKGDQFLHIRV